MAAASSAADPPRPTFEQVEALRALLDVDGEAVLDRAKVRLHKNVVTVRRGTIERTYGVKRLEQALDFARVGSREPPPPSRPRRYPGKPACYRPPKQIARELKAMHKEGLLLDIPIPEVPADED